MLGIPGQLFVRLEQFNELDGLREDVSCHQDQPLQGICGFFERHSRGGGLGHGGVSVGDEVFAYTSPLRRAAARPRCCNVLSLELKYVPHLNFG